MFLDYRLKENVEYGSEFGGGFKTDVGETSAGYEYRDQRFSLPRFAGNIIPGIDTDGDFANVRDLFMVARGRTHTWRFKDWMDYTVTDESLGVLTTGAEETVQLGKYYDIGVGTPLFRPLWRWVTSTLVVKVSGSVDSDGSLDSETGIWTFGSSTSPFLVPGAEVTVTGQFDCEVRFDTDIWPGTLQTFKLDKSKALPIVEVRSGNG